MRIKSIISGLLGLTLVNAKLVMVIRHGEKIDDDHTDLSPQGQARAECLVNVFGNNGTYISPQKIYAQSPTPQRQSTRPRDTVVPLADALGLQIDLSYTSGKVKKLSQYIMNSPEEVILVSWGNDKIPIIAEEFGIVNPPDWEKHCFDDIWILSDGKTSYLKQGNGLNSNTVNTANTGFDNAGYANNANTGIGNTANTGINNNVNTGFDNNVGANNSGFVKREPKKGAAQVAATPNQASAFTLKIEKQGIEQCINEKLQVQTQGNNSQNLNSGSYQLKTGVFMTLFSALLYALVYYY